MSADLKFEYNTALSNMFDSVQQAAFETVASRRLSRALADHVAGDADLQAVSPSTIATVTVESVAGHPLPNSAQP